MINAIKDQEATLIFSVLDLDGLTPKTGEALNLTVVLRDEDGAAVEVVTISEQGTSGYYEARFTPTKGSADGFGYTFFITEPAGTSERVLTWDVRSFNSSSFPGVGTGNVLTSLANVKQYIDPTLTTTDVQDDFLNALIARATAAIQSYCQYTFFDTEFTEFHDGKAYDMLILRERPIISVTSVHDDTGRTFDAGKLIDAANYYPDLLSGIIERTDGYIFVDGRRNVKVIYRAGYTTVPNDIEEACVILVAHRFRGKESVMQEAKDVEGGSDITFKKSDFPEDVVQLLEPYKKRRQVA